MTKPTALGDAVTVTIQDRAFQVADYDGAFPKRESAALQQAGGLSLDTLVANDEAVLVAAIVDYFAARRVVMHYDHMWVDRREFSSGMDPSNPGPTQMYLDFMVPCEGAAGEVRGPTSGGQTIAAREPIPKATWGLRFGVPLSPEPDWDAEQLQAALEDFRTRWRVDLQAAIDEANVKIDAHRAEVERVVAAEIRRRRNPAVAVQMATRNLSIPLSRQDAGASLIPVAPRHLSLAAAEESVSGGVEPFYLANSIAEGLLQNIASFSRALEHLPVTADKLSGEDEETLRDVLLFILNANWAGQVTGETFIGIGKTDISLRWKDLTAFIAECKFWKGPQHLNDAVDQLLDRYVVWRDTRAALVLFIRDRADQTRAIDSAAKTLEDNDRILRSDPWDGDKTRRDFYLQSGTDAGRSIRLSLMPVIIPNRSES